MDLKETCGTCYKKHIEVEIIDGFKHQNVAFMNEKVQLFVDYWIKPYLISLIQRDRPMFLNYYLKNLQKKAKD